MRRALADLRCELLAAEIEKRWALIDTDVPRFLAACALIKSIQNAIFNLEAQLLAEGKRDELLPPAPENSRDRETAEVRH